jgi:hypothetical protein
MALASSPNTPAATKPTSQPTPAKCAALARSMPWSNPTHAASRPVMGMRVKNCMASRKWRTKGMEGDCAASLVALRRLNGVALSKIYEITRPDFVARYRPRPRLSPIFASQPHSITACWVLWRAVSCNGFATFSWLFTIKKLATHAIFYWASGVIFLPFFFPRPFRYASRAGSRFI